MCVKLRTNMLLLLSKLSGTYSIIQIYHYLKLIQIHSLLVIYKSQYYSIYALFCSKLIYEILWKETKK